MFGTVGLSLRPRLQGTDSHSLAVVEVDLYALLAEVPEPGGREDERQQPQEDNEQAQPSSGHDHLTFRK